MNTAATGKPSRSRLLVSVILLTVITLLAFANAWHDSLVFDDKIHVGPDRLNALPVLYEAFQRDIWGNAHGGRGLYRPLLQITFELETRLFGDWLPGYHMVNVLLHLGASLLLLGFLRMLLARHGHAGSTGELAALLGALVFAVHPVHTEVINSVFNGSSIHVSILAIAGLWWLLHHLESSPARAWIGLGAAYSTAIFFKESALVLPGIAVAMIVLLTPGSAVQRIRRFLPVFWLLIPIAIYFFARANALSGGSEDIDKDLNMMLDSTRLASQQTLASALRVCGVGLKLFLWPHPLQIFYSYLSPLMSATLLGGQLLLALLALYRFLKGRPALAAGLAFYYVAMMPATRLISMDGSWPHIAERYLYYPSIGLAIALAFGCAALLRRFGSRAVVAVALPLVLLLSVLCWERNYEWSSEIMLFETEYSLGNNGLAIIRILASAHLLEGRYSRITDICDENDSKIQASGKLASTCAVAYLNTNRLEDAIRALEYSLEDKETWLKSRVALAKLEIQRGNRQEGANHFTYIINRLEKPYQKEFFKGLLYFHVYPNSPKYLQVARTHLETALQLNPEMKAAQQWIEYVDGILDPSDGEAPVAPEIEE